MEFFSSFTGFIKRVMQSVKKGGLGNDDTNLLNRLLQRTRKKNFILAKGILSALSVGGATKKDVESFGGLLEKAHNRIMKDREPFTKDDERKISEIFRKSLISEKAAKWFASNLDELVATEIEDFIRGRQIEVSKKTVRFETNEKKRKIAI